MRETKLSVEPRMRAERSDEIDFKIVCGFSQRESAVLPARASPASLADVEYGDGRRARIAF
jgi:hypothetical protein